MVDRSLFILAILLALVFLGAGVVWAYYFALVIGYPAGFVSLLIWRRLARKNFKASVLIPFILVAAVTLSLSVLAFQLLKG